MKSNTIKIFVLFFLLMTSLSSMGCKADEKILKKKLSTEYYDARLRKVLKDAHIPEYHYQLINEYSHESTSFTEGLLLFNDYIYESTGLRGQSKLFKIDLNSGKILEKHSLPDQYFGEGITVLDNKLYQLTYQEQSAFVYDINTFEVTNTFRYLGEGWGLTTNGKHLIMSNGSARISFLDPKTFKTVSSILVTVNKNTIKSLNELQYINGLIYANVWPTSIIVIFSPQNGQIVGWLDITVLKSNYSGEANGIAYDERNHLLLVTGKNWPKIYVLWLTAPKIM